MNKKEFIEKFKYLVEPDINELERERDINYRKYLRTKKLFIFFISQYLVCFFITSFFMITNSTKLASTFFNLSYFSFFIMFIGIICFCCGKRNNYKEKYSNFIKEKYLKDILKAFGNIQKTEQTFDIQTLENSKLFGYFSSMTTDDTFIGTHRNTDFIISEIKLTKRTRTKNGYSTRTIFDGVVINFHSPKDVNGGLIIKNKYSNTNLIIPLFLSFIATIFSLIATRQNPQKIECWIATFMFILGFSILIYKIINSKYKKEEIKDIDFMKQYTIHSLGNINVNEIITPTFIKRFRDFEEIFGKDNIKFSLFNNNIMIAIGSNKNLFELSDFKTPINSPKLASNFYDQITSIFRIIDNFNGNENTDG